MAHHHVNLELGVDKPDNVYRYIESWQAVPSAHGMGIHYLFLHGIFQWGRDRQHPVRAFSIAMQYSPRIGQTVDVSQPAHILEEDLGTVLEAFSAFVSKCITSSDDEVVTDVPETRSHREASR